MGKDAEKKQQINVTARAPFHVYYEGAAESLTAKNKVGKFDILPGHADFFSMLDKGDVTITNKTEQVIFPITHGIVTVHNDEVLLFVNM